jgi:hypothetical protein
MQTVRDARDSGLMVISVNRKDARIGKFPACLKFFWAMRKLKIN